METLERKILSIATELDPGPNGYHRLCRLMSSPLDKVALVEMAVEEGLGGFLYKSLKKSDLLKTLGEEQREMLQIHYYQTVRFNLNLLHDLQEALYHGSQRGILVVLLQGIELLLDLYEDPGVRPMTDIDLWILKKDYQSFVTILSGRGYERDPVYPNTYRRGSTTLDLHTHLLWTDRIISRRFLLNCSEEEILHRVRTIRLGDEAALCLDVYDQVIYLSLHALKHRFNRLIWLVDIKNISSRWKSSDWETLHQRAGELGQQKVLSYALSLLSSLLNYHPPKEIRLIWKKRLNLLERRALMGRVKGHSLPMWAPLLLFSPQKDLKGHLSFIIETLFPRPEVLRQVFPSPHDVKPWQLYLKRVLQILRRIKISLQAS